MIVRIAGEDQFRLDGGHESRLRELDEAVLEAVERGDQAGFEAAFAELLSFVRASGTVLGEDELASSDLILPPPDTTLAEAAENFSGEGWLPE
ncbi:MAG: hypothetical protein KGJ43_02050 [Acidobacteriota bacterium]|nr:hypothetical protein [Acidobacteriota bacterium]